MLQLGGGGGQIIRCASAVCAIACMTLCMFLLGFVIKVEAKALFGELFSCDGQKDKNLV